MALTSMNYCNLPMLSFNQEGGVIELIFTTPSTLTNSFLVDGRGNLNNFYREGARGSFVILSTGVCENNYPGSSFTLTEEGGGVVNIAKGGTTYHLKIYNLPSHSQASTLGCRYDEAPTTFNGVIHEFKMYGPGLGFGLSNHNISNRTPVPSVHFKFTHLQEKGSSIPRNVWFPVEEYNLPHHQSGGIADKGSGWTYNATAKTWSRNSNAASDLRLCQLTYYPVNYKLSYEITEAPSSDLKLWYRTRDNSPSVGVTLPSTVGVHEFYFSCYWEVNNTNVPRLHTTSRVLVIKNLKIEEVPCVYFTRTSGNAWKTTDV